MAKTIKCPDCGHTEQSDDGEPETCPKCEGTMVPTKKKPQSKPTAPEPEERARKQAPPRANEDERPKPRKKAAAEVTSLDEGEGRGKGGNPQNGAAAKRAGLPSGLDDAELVAQVEEELEPGEVLHFACRQAKRLAQLQSGGLGCGAVFFTVVFGLIGVSQLRGAKESQDYLFGLVFVAVAIAAAVVGVLSARGRMRQAARGWYAVTDRRAIVYEVSLIAGKGEATAYAPDQLRKMWVRKSFWLKGGGDVVFKTVVTITTTVSEKSEKSEKSTTHYGFIGVENADAVRDVIEWAVLSDERGDDE